eukprot:Colp12_sorted_trinity150504_noHs@29865
MGLFGKSKTPQEQVREWKTKLRSEERALERQILSIDREEKKLQVSIKQAAKKGDQDVCKILAKELVHSRKAKSKLYTSKAQINSVSLQMQNQLATAKISGAIAKSTEVMKAMNKLVKVPEIAAAMQELSKEMMKAGIIEEMVEDALDQDDAELEEAADEEVNKVLFELTNGILGQAGEVGADLEEEKAGKEEDVEDIRARLEALKG